MAKTKPEAKSKRSKSEAYGADSLRELHYPDNVRNKIGMYLGSADEAGAYRALKEIADNSFDEAMAGHGKKINIVYNTEKNLVTVVDQGRGLPMGKNRDGKFASEVALATLHGSGKFDAKNYAGGVIGTHGVGAACTNAVSEHFTVWSKNTGKWMMQRFERGVKVHDPKPEAPKSKIALKNDKGTVIQFKLDKKIFGNVVIEAERIHNEMRHIAMLNPGLSIVVDVDGEARTYKSDNGLIDMIVTEESSKSTLGKPFSLQVKKAIDIAVCWRDDADSETFSYVNSSFTAQEGTHVQGARTAILEILKGELSDKDKLDPKFFLRGMRLALNWRMENPIYAGQTKDRLSNTEVVTQVKKIITPAFAEFVKKNKGLISGLIERAKKFQANEEKFLADNKAVKSIKLVDPTSRGILPGKLCQAHGYKPDEKELILVEGDSAEGCFLGSTKVRLLNGRTKTFTRLVEDEKVGKKNYGYAYDAESMSTIVVKLEAPRITKYVRDLVEVTLSNGKVETCTPEHLWMLRDGSYKKAIDLSDEDELMPHTEYVHDDRRYVVSPKLTKIGTKTVRGKREAVYRLAVHLRRKNIATYKALVSEGVRINIHHKDHNKLNDLPGNLVVMSEIDHLQEHADEAPRFTSQTTKGKRNGHYRKMRDDEEYRMENIARTQKYFSKYWSSIKHRKEQSQRTSAHFSDPKNRAKHRVNNTKEVVEKYKRIVRMCGSNFSENVFNNMRAKLAVELGVKRINIRFDYWKKFRSGSLKSFLKGL